MGAGRPAAIDAGLEQAGKCARAGKISVAVGPSDCAVVASVPILERLAGVIVNGLPLITSRHHAIG